MEIITENKVKLLRWLTGEGLILQYVHSRKLITETEYTKVKSIQDPTENMTELLDLVLKKGESTCIKFLELLKENDVNESRPELQAWITTVNTSEIIPAAPQSSVQRSGTTVTIDAKGGPGVYTPIIVGSQISVMTINTSVNAQK